MRKGLNGKRRARRNGMQKKSKESADVRRKGLNGKSRTRRNGMQKESKESADVTNSLHRSQMVKESDFLLPICL